jgi:DNA polymerase elongation subunit (family B)
MQKATVKEIEEYLEGYDEQKYIVGIESNYYENKVSLIVHDPEKGKRIEKHKFRPFMWMKTPDVDKLYGGDRREIKKKMREFSVSFKELYTSIEGEELVDRLINGYKYLAQTKKSYGDLIKFFKEGGVDPFSEENRSNFMTINPSEQFLIQTGKRLFKGMEDYEDIHRMSYDIETTGLFPETSRIFQIGIKDNRGFEHVLNIEGEEGSEELLNREAEAIVTFFKIISHLKPAIVAGYNSENFDWDFIVKRAVYLGLDIKKVAKTLGPVPFYRKRQTLKMGPEMEYYDQTHMWGYNIMDVSHAVRRAQAINSSIKGWSLKYITKYAGAAKPNRVYVQGDIIGKTWLDTENDYWFNDTNGEWGKITDELPEGCEKVTGAYIVERYLIDDLWETEKVDNIFNQATFLLAKILPTSYMRSATMGTAATWKLLMLGWSYHKNIGIPETEPLRPFVGGLSRLLEVGYAKNVIKFDFDGLYPSEQLTHGIFTKSDITGAMNGLLQYNYDNRNLYKKLKKDYAKEGDMEKSAYYDKKQLPLKILNNGMFGSISAPNVFPWGDTNMGEMITCTGRQYLRHMIRFMRDKGFKALVGDSVTAETPIYIKWEEDGMIDILPVSDIFEEVTIDIDGQQRDFSKKPFKVLTNEGWCDIDYVYRHKTDKPIHRVTTRNRIIDCTSDHSLFSDGKEISPLEMKRGDKLDSVVVKSDFELNDISLDLAWLIGFFVADGSSVYGDRKQKYYSKRKKEYVYHNGKRSSFTINNNDLDKLEKSKRIVLEEFGVDSPIKDYRKSSSVYKLKTHYVKISKWFSENCYDKNRIKKIPKEILNSSKDIKKSFMDGFCAGDGWGDDLSSVKNITQKSLNVMAGIHIILNELDKDYTLKLRKDKLNIISFNFGENYPVNKEKSYNDNDKVWNSDVIHKEYNDYVYDISANGTFIAGIGCIVAHNTDGFNFSIPDGVDDLVYVSDGRHHSTEEGKEYRGAEAVVSEYNDLYMYGVMGLSIDEVCEATINLARKNYADLIDGEVKLVGNTIKSKKLQGFVSDFIDVGIRMLLEGDGSGFVNEYYDTIERLYNLEVPLSKIANKSRVRMSKKDYIKRRTQLNKAGNPLPKQAHMELMLQHNLDLDLGTTIYYVNVGTKKGDGDVQTKKKWNKTKIKKYTEEHGNFPFDPEEKELIINCELVPSNIIENEPEKSGNYNYVRYIEAFNKRIKPLLVCFHPDVREDILITTPEDRQYFTSSQLELTSGMPYNESDQDKLEELLQITEQEMTFWNNMNLSPTYMFEQFDIVDEYCMESKLDYEDS